VISCTRVGREPNPHIAPTAFIWRARGWVPGRAGAADAPSDGRSALTARAPPGEVHGIGQIEDHRREGIGQAVYILPERLSSRRDRTIRCPKYPEAAMTVGLTVSRSPRVFRRS